MGASIVEFTIPSYWKAVSSQPSAFSNEFLAL